MIRKVFKGKQNALRVKEPMELMTFLGIHFNGKSRSDLKFMLSHKQVCVNGAPVLRFDHPLLEGDTITFTTGKVEHELRHPKLKIMYEDDYLIVVEKEEGLLSVATGMGREETTAFSLLADYQKEKNPRNRLFIVHRIDRETSGVMMFVKTREAQEVLRDNWNESVTERVYIAVVEGAPKRTEDTVVSYLHEDRSFRVHSNQKDDGRGKEAITHYRVIRQNDRYAMLKVELDTGRKNQIRVHMQDIGHPIVGDLKYGASSSPIGRIGLHAQVLAFVHPITKEILRFETPIPKKFNALFDRK
ncbi:MAG: RluA family pseudouridine synthase [Tannerella sp.]|jgi:23S rRNA pseudouridine1911/1915/1917 synthase|nr:RluA family pseudouridine synthase [Tannerella sp.]